VVGKRLISRVEIQVDRLHPIHEAQRQWLE
jgi:hypothetical protein